MSQEITCNTAFYHLAYIIVKQIFFFFPAVSNGLFIFMMKPMLFITVEQWCNTHYVSVLCDSVDIYINEL